MRNESESKQPFKDNGRKQVRILLAEDNAEVLIAVSRLRQLVDQSRDH